MEIVNACWWVGLLHPPACIRLFVPRVVRLELIALARGQAIPEPYKEANCNYPPNNEA